MSKPSDDVERAVKAMSALGMWYARTPGSWIEDGGACIDTGAAFSKDLAISLTCTCDRQHAFRSVAECVEETPQWSIHDKKKRRVSSIIKALHDGISWKYPAAPGEIVTLPWSRTQFIDPDGRRFDLPDGRWFAIQERYYQGALRLAGVTEWWAIHPSIPSTTQVVPDDYPIMVGKVDGKVAALIRPCSRPCRKEWTLASEPRVAAGGPT
jgi:hypothetical protein